MSRKYSRHEIPTKSIGAVTRLQLATLVNRGSKPFKGSYEGVLLIS